MVANRGTASLGLSTRPPRIRRMALWKFRAHRSDEKIRNPIQGEFFSEEAVERPAQALVREVIQNSLDARAGEAPVEVRFTVSSSAGLGEATA